MKKLFKLLSLLRLIRDLRHGGGYRRDYGHSPYDHGYRRRDYYHPRSHDYHPLYRRGKKPKLKHVVRDLVAGRRY